MDNKDRELASKSESELDELWEKADNPNNVGNAEGFAQGDISRISKQKQRQEIAGKK